MVDRVIDYAKCEMCLNQSEMLCRNGGKEIGLVTNEGFAECIAVPERNVFKYQTRYNES
jgi:D-arabinose 1-dehydrogenase-like Zn-dependent alcohol dehydrogenase